MEYQVWTFVEYEGWKKIDCADLKAAQQEILKALTAGKEPLLTAAIPYDFSIQIKEDKIGEALKGKTEPDKGPGVAGEGEVRPGNDDSVSELDQGSWDPSACHLLPSE